jgi:hypothetical protein
LFGISLLLALCAAAWFSGGTWGDNLCGMLALCGWFLARASGRRLAASGPSAPARASAPAPALASAPASAPAPALASAPAPAPAAAPGWASASASAWMAPGRAVGGGLTGSTDWLALPGATWDDVEQIGGREHRSASGGWPAAVCTTVAECAVYGGIAAGGQSAGWTGMWPLAVMAISAVAVRGTVGSCALLGAPARGVPWSGTSSGRTALGTRIAAIRRATGTVFALSAGTRLLLAAVALAAYGPRMAIFVILAIESISTCCAIVGTTRFTGSGRDVGTGRAVSAAPDPNPVPAAHTAAPTRPEAVLAGRDDGMAARWTGRLVRGQFVPLPPALVGVSALVLLAALGLRHLPGILVLTPVVVMMLAAPGSSHPHDGRLDWLTPVLLQIGQYLYLAALGFASNVPGPVVYSLCALTAIWYASLAADAGGSAVRPAWGPGAPGSVRGADSPRPPVGAGSSQPPVGAGSPRSAGGADSQRPPVGAGSPRPARGPARQRSARFGAGLGWEGRMFVVGLGAMLGGAGLAYLALAAYLGVLVGRRVVVGCLMPREGDRR